MAVRRIVEYTYTRNVIPWHCHRGATPSHTRCLSKSAMAVHCSSSCQGSGMVRPCLRDLVLFVGLGKTSDLATVYLHGRDRPSSCRRYLLFAKRKCSFTSTSPWSRDLGRLRSTNIGCMVCWPPESKLRVHATSRATTGHHQIAWTGHNIIRLRKGPIFS